MQSRRSAASSAQSPSSSTVCPPASIVLPNKPQRVRRTDVLVMGRAATTSSTASSHSPSSPPRLQLVKLRLDSAWHVRLSSFVSSTSCLTLRPGSPSQSGLPERSTVHNAMLPSACARRNATSTNPCTEPLLQSASVALVSTTQMPSSPATDSLHKCLHFGRNSTSENFAISCSLISPQSISAQS